MTTELKFRLEGIVPLLYHNIRLANQYDPYTKAIKAITSKKDKTDEDDMELTRLEFLGGLYLEIDDGPEGNQHKNPYVPSDWIEGMIRKGASARKLGKEIEKAVIATDPRGFPLVYDGPKNVDDLIHVPQYCFRKIVSVSRSSKVMRTRCRFMAWSVTASVLVDMDIMKFEDVKQAAKEGVTRGCLGDWRPKYGRSNIEFLNEAKPAL